MNIEKLKHAARIARTDLSFALMQVKFGDYRLKQSIRMLTEALEDSEEFEKLQKRWERESAELK